MSNDDAHRTAATAPGYASSSDLPAGFTVGEYRIEGVAGRGGMGVVYEAIQPVIEKRVAIKVLNAQLSQDRELVRRFVDEARAVNRIGHENIIDIFSFGQLPDGRQYFVMEYLAGDTLAARLNRADLLSSDFPSVLAQICEALEAAHAKKIVHRDLKPENV
jgi:serine/threonine protein kinase